jgi:hypothetical protein
MTLGRRISRPKRVPRALLGLNKAVLMRQADIDAGFAPDYEGE